jgi:hypothetical protein
LVQGTLYHVRAYATNATGTGYGSDLTFTTSGSGSILVTGLSINSIPVNSIHTVSTYHGTLQLGVTSVIPSNATNKTVTWSVTNGTGSGSITSSGLFTATTNGNVVVYATANDGSGVQDNFIITISNQIVITYPTVTTTAITNIAQITATSGGNVTSDGGASVTAKGVCWSININPTTANSLTNDGTGTGTYPSSLTGLLANTLYHVRAYATNSAGTAYGNDLTFTTLAVVAVLPTVTTTVITNIAQTTATSGGNVTSDGGAIVTARGVCWDMSGSPALDNVHTTDATGTGIFTSSITGLTPNTTYYVRAYATNSVGTAYGARVQFNTLVTPPTPVLATVTTTVTSNIAQTTATSGGNVTLDGGATVTAKGVCWSINVNPTISSSLTNDGTGIGVYVSSLSGLLPNTLYHVRAYATNSVGTAYGSDITFTTLSIPVVLPTVTTTTVTSIGNTTAISGGNVTADGGATVTAYGVCYNTTSYPSLISPHTTDGSGMSNFVSSLTGLSANTTYHVRAYATNSAGTAYGADIAFTTLTVNTTIPTVTTLATTLIVKTTATSGGNVTSDGGVQVTVRGVCWNTTGSPTISDSRMADGIGTGSYILNLTGLTKSTVYYIRAYATNSVGTAYGNILTFKTDDVPVLTTTPVYAIQQTTAKSGGNIIADDGFPVAVRGVCWSTNPNPISTDAHGSNGVGMGAYPINISGLLPNTTYHARAYAINTGGVGYGDEVVFTTLSPAVLATVTTSISETVAWTAEFGFGGTSSIKLNCTGEITSTGNTPITSKGFCWGTTTNPTVTANRYVYNSSLNTGTGIFTAFINSLSPNNTYHIRAFAKNKIGTAYGNDITVTIPVYTITGN